MPAYTTTPDKAQSRHRVHFSSNLHGRQLDVFAWSPDKFTLNFQNHWDSPFLKLMEKVQGVTGMLGTAVRTGGYAVNSQQLTALTWEASAPPSIGMTLIFNAEADTLNDVQTPIANLLAMALPNKKQGSDFLVETPGPSTAAYLSQLLKSYVNGSLSNVQDGDENTVNESISFTVGNMLRIDSVVIDSCNITQCTRSDQTGLPIYAEFNVVVRPFVAPYLSDVYQWLGVSNPNGQ